MSTHAIELLLRSTRRHSQRMSRGVLLPVVILLALIFAAGSFVAYMLWPRWPEPAISSDAPSLPITIANVAFNIPSAAIRMPVQRRPGAQERVDLAFQWPSLEAPDRAHKITAPVADAPTAAIERVFVTIAAAGDTLPPTERLKSIYPRYASTAPLAGPTGLAVLPFREGTPYQGEDLIYDAQQPDNFLVRCTRNGAGPTPGTCLYERRIETADMVVRFPRDWLDDWEDVAGTIDRLIKSLRPLGG